MASTINTTSAFIAKPLAVLPADEKQANDRRFMKELTVDRHLAWEAEEARLNQLRLEERASFAAWRACQDKEEKAVIWHQNSIHRASTDAQLSGMMFVPAPSHRVVKWKMRMKMRLTPAAQAAVDRDLEWLGPLPVKAPRKSV